MFLKAPANQENCILNCFNQWLSVAALLLSLKSGTQALVIITKPETLPRGEQPHALG